MAQLKSRRKEQSRGGTPPAKIKQVTTKIARVTKPETVVTKLVDQNLYDLCSEDVKYQKRLAQWLGIKNSQLTNRANALIAKLYVKKSRSQTFRKISYETYLKAKPDPTMPPHPIFRLKAWSEAVERFQAKSNLELIKILLDLSDAEQDELFYLFDSAFYRSRYGPELNGLPPILHFLNVGMMEGNDTTPFLRESGLWQFWVRDVCRLDEAVSPPIDNEYYRYAAGKLCGILVIYGSRHDIFNVEPLKVLDDYIQSDSYKMWKNLLSATKKFDPIFYRDSNIDLIDLNDIELEAHYTEFGMDEGRKGSFYEVLVEAETAFNALPAVFDWEYYRRSSSDLSDYNNETICLLHYIRFGHRENRMATAELPVYDLSGLPTFVPFSQKKSRRPLKHGKVKLYFHVYYGHLIDDYIKVIESAHALGADIYVNCANGGLQASELKKLAEYDPKIIVSRNVGRDLGGYFSLHRAFPLAPDDIVIMMHTKLSPHIPNTRRLEWVNDLLDAIGQDRHSMHENIAALRTDQTINMIGAVKRLHLDNGGRNKSNVKLLLDRLDIDEKAMLFPFISGLMGIYRGSVLNKMFAAISFQELEVGRPDDLSFNVDGQMAHALERVLGIISHHHGNVIWR